jgi:hypothetical protein
MATPKKKELTSAPKKPDKALQPEKDWLPGKWYHLLVLSLLIAIAAAYYLPALGGKSLNADDYIQGVTITKELRDHYESTGEVAHWTGTLFSGMPAFQVWHPFSNLPYQLHFFLYKIFNIYLFISLLIISAGFILFYVLRVKPLIIFTGVIGLLFSNFTVVSIFAGHNNKVQVIAWVPATIAGIWLLYEKRRYWLGAFIIAFSMAMQILNNHFQITYFMMFLVGSWTLVKVVEWAKEKEFKHAAICLGVMAFSMGAGILNNSAQLLSTLQYSQETQRGGPSPVEAARSEGAIATSGVDYDYATMWSYGKLESFTLLIPDFSGGASVTALDQNSNVYKTLTQNGVPPQQAIQFSSGMPTYWGAQPFTAGTTYIGAIFIYLLVLGLALLKGSTRWWVIATLAITLFVTWGKNFDFFYKLLYNYLPYFNKFRTPAMAFYVTTLTTIIVAALALQQIVSQADNRELLWDKFKKVSIGFLGFMAFMAIAFPMFWSFESTGTADASFRDQLLQSTGNNAAFVNSIYEALLLDRKAMMQKDAFRSLILVALSAGLIVAFLKRKAGAQVMLTGIALLVLFDVVGVNLRYVNHDSFQTNAVTGKAGLPMSEADRFILQDKDISYRVLDLTSNPFSSGAASYFHKSIGGYHSAKLKRYQDIISYQINPALQKLSGGAPQEAYVLNMLNTRYLISSKDASGVYKNQDAYGNAWLVDTVLVMKDAVEVFDNLSEKNLRNIALLEQPEETISSQSIYEKDVTAYIRLEKYSPDFLTYSYQSETPSFAVFSEVYYNDEKGWVAYLDGEKVPHYRTNYILRGMNLPAGEHVIEFKFEPTGILKSQKLDWAGTFLILLAGLGALYTNREKFLPKKSEA